MAPEQRLAEVIKWYSYHRGTLPADDLRKRCEFQEIAINNVLNVMIDIVAELQERRVKSSALYLPRGIILNGDDARGR